MTYYCPSCGADTANPCGCIDETVYCYVFAAPLGWYWAEDQADAIRLPDCYGPFKSEDGAREAAYVKYGDAAHIQTVLADIN